MSTSTPPSAGPKMVTRLVVDDHSPMARPREEPGKTVLISARLPGISSAPPMP
ncbi:hypothetical protein N0D28_10005 [Deinococcus rubellus]|uniref:Uncharacterized protein n=1 Tax=Deinococcus rubellus TaxID=1889240 RepID=A0ABY5YDF0_9DEIO|nr:hypothetical protein [Deinococcus rubellus]UWX63092.1 hypothetical protein N0D28_10005 [Deinococcus rubellus]